MKYTYSEEEDGGSDTLSMRRSNQQSGMSTPAEPSGPTFTASGRQVRSRHGGAYGESMLSGKADDSRPPSISGMDGADEEDDQPVSCGRPRRAAQQNETNYKAHSKKHIDGYIALDSMDDNSDASLSGGEWDGGDDDEPDDVIEEEDDDVEMSDDEANPSEEEEEEEDVPQSLIVSLRYEKTHSSPPNTTTLSTNDRNPMEKKTEPTLPAVKVTQPSYNPLETSAATTASSDTPVSVATVLQYSQPSSIPAKLPTYSSDQTTAYVRPPSDAAPTERPTHTFQQNVPHAGESIPVPNHTFQPRPEAKNGSIIDPPRQDAVLDGTR